jgi:uncharacterized protein YkwD
MKKKYIFVISITLIIFFSLFPSCKKDEGFHQISDIEREIYLKINNYRATQELNSLVEQFLLFKEGRVISEKMAADVYTAGDPEAQNDLDELTENLGGNSNSLIMLNSNIANADSIVNFLSSEPSAIVILRGSFTQCGVGFSTDTDNLHHIAILFMNIPN